MCQKLWKLVGSRQSYCNDNQACFLVHSAVYTVSLRLLNLTLWACMVSDLVHSCIKFYYSKKGESVAKRTLVAYQYVQKVMKWIIFSGRSHIVQYSHNKVFVIEPRIIRLKPSNINNFWTSTGKHEIKVDGSIYCIYCSHWQAASRERGARAAFIVGVPGHRVVRQVAVSNGVDSHSPWSGVWLHCRGKGCRQFVSIRRTMRLRQRRRQRRTSCTEERYEYTSNSLQWQRNRNAPMTNVGL